MIGLSVKSVFGAWPLVLAVLGAALVLDAAAVWRWRHRRLLALVLGAAGVAITAALLLFTGVLVALMNMT